MLGDVSATFALAEQMESPFPAVDERTEVVHAASAEAVTEGGVTVQVHSDGPLRTTLTATKRTTTPPRHEAETVYAA